MKMMLRWFLPCLLLWASALQAAPDFPMLSGRVVDEASLMSRKQAHQLTQQLAAFEKRSGIQLVVSLSTASMGRLSRSTATSSVATGGSARKAKTMACCC